MSTARALALPREDWMPAAASASVAAGPWSVVARTARDLPALSAEWQALAPEASETNTFAEPWFVAAGVRHLAGADEIVIAEARDAAGRLQGAMPLFIARDYGRLRVRHVENWRHHHCFLGTPIVRAGGEREYWQAIIRWLDSSAWAQGFLHVNGLVEDGPVHRGLVAAATALGRRVPTVHRVSRAELASTLSPLEYYETTVRKKKRKELARLRNRLGEMGSITTRTLAHTEPLAPWCDAFLSLERSGWKGDAGSALACNPDTEAFFREALAGARAAGRLEMLGMDLDGRTIAMLVNFIAPPGSFSFKIAYDEAFARFSPGVLIQLENLNILARGDIAWMDSCAVENHAMIESLWGERRTIVRVTVPLSGTKRRATYALCRGLERASGLVRRLAAGSRS